jgi:hypothetical protein
MAYLLLPKSRPKPLLIWKTDKVGMTIKKDATKICTLVCLVSIESCEEMCRSPKELVIICAMNSTTMGT